MPIELSPEEFAQQFGRGYVVDAPKAGLGTLFGSSVDNTQAGLLNLASQFTVQGGDTYNMLQQARRENLAASNLSSQRYYQNTGSPSSIKDVESLGGLGRYATNLAVGSALPMAATALGGLAAGPAGALAVGSTLGTADVLENQMEAGGRTNIGAALPLGVAYGAVDSLTGIGGMMTRRSVSGGVKALEKAGTKYLDGITGLKGVAARTAASFGKKGLEEGVGETTQEFANQLGRMAVSDEGFFDPAALERYGESFAGGALLGGMTGAIGGGWRRSKGLSIPSVDSGSPVDLTKRSGGPSLLTSSPTQEWLDKSLGIGSAQPQNGYEKELASLLGQGSGQYLPDPTSGSGFERELSMQDWTALKNGAITPQEIQQRWVNEHRDTLNGIIGGLGGNRSVASTQIGDSNPGVFANMVYGQGGLGGNQNDLLGTIAGSNPSLGEPGGREAFAHMVYGQGGLGGNTNDLLGSIAGSNPSLGAPGGPRAFDSMLYGQGGLVDPNTLFDLQTQPAPLQQRIDQNMGIGQPGAPKNYPQQFRAAASEPTNLWAIDPATGHEVRLDAGQASAIHAGDDVQLTPEQQNIKANADGFAAERAAAHNTFLGAKVNDQWPINLKTQEVNTYRAMNNLRQSGVMSQDAFEQMAGEVQEALQADDAKKLKQINKNVTEAANKLKEQPNGTQTTQAQQAAPQGSQAPAAAAPAAAVSNKAPVVSGEAPVVAPKQPRTLAERAAEAWGSLAKVTPHMPAYESLSDNQRRGIEDLVNRGEFDLAAANTVAGKVASGLDKIAEGDQAADAPVDAPSVAKRLVEIVVMRPSDPNRPKNPEAAAIYDERMGNYTKAIPTRPELKAALLHVLTTTKSPQIRSRLTLATGYDVSEEDGVPHLIQVNNPATLTQVAEHELSGGDEKVELDPQKVASLKASISKQLGKNTGFYQEVIDRVVANDAPEPVSGSELGLDENGKLDKYQTGDTISEVTGTQLTESVQDHIKKRVKAELKLIAKDGYSDEAIAAAYERLSQIETRESKASRTESEQSDDETAGGRDTLFDNRSEADATEDGESKSQDDGNAAESNSNAYTDALAEALANKVLDTKRKRTRVALGDAKLDEAEKQKRQIAAIRSAVDTLRLFARQPGFTEAASAWNILRSEGVPDFEQLPVVRQAAWVQTYFQQLRNVNDKTINNDQFRWELENEQRSFEVGADFALESKLERAATGSSNDRAVESNRAGSDGSRTAAAEPQDVGTRAKAKLKKVGYKASKTDLTDEELAWAIKEFERLNNGDALADARKVAESRQAAAPVAETEERPATPFTQEVTTEPVEEKNPAAKPKTVADMVTLGQLRMAGQIWGQYAPEGVKWESQSPEQQKQWAVVAIEQRMPNMADAQAIADGTFSVAEVEQDERSTTPFTGQLSTRTRTRNAGRAQAQITDESNIIDVEARVVDETVRPQVAALPAPQVQQLEKHYGLKRDSAEFLAKVKEDVVLYATKGAEAVAGAIRHIIKSIANGVLSVAMIFNPMHITSPEAFVVVPKATVVTTTREVKAELPSNVKGMSEAGKQAYATLIPALSTKIGDKLITIADKPSGQIFVFDAKGNLVVQKKTLFGLAKGDLYKGNNNLPQNRITPAGLFGLKLVDAAKGGSATKTAGEYDFGKVFAFEDPDAVVTIMHSVWLKEKDAAKRSAALKDANPANSRYSFGCINVDKDTYKFLLDKYQARMDGSKLFVVPDEQAKVGDFLAGNVPYDKMNRHSVGKTTETVTSVMGGNGATGIGQERTIVGKKEDDAQVEKAKFSKSSKATKGSDAKTLAAELRAFMRVGTLGDRVVVVQSIKDIPAGVQRSVGASNNTQGFVFGGKAYLIADQIAAGNGRAVFMHEVGAHLGMEEILGAHYDTLVGKVIEWAKRVDNSQEFKLADKAIQRALDAAGNGELNDTELVAYFIEEAINAGIEPSALKHGPLRQFMQQIFDLFKKAIARFYGNPDKVTAQDFVDLAYGAARIEMKEPINPGGGDGGVSKSVLGSSRANGTPDGRKPTKIFMKSNGWGQAYNESVQASFRELDEDWDEDLLYDHPELDGSLLIANVDRVSGGTGGRASEVLKAITNFADERGQRIVLAAKASGWLKQAALVAWYARNGFSDYDGYMLREPKPLSTDKPKFSIAKKAEDQARKVAGETGAKIAVDTTNLASKALGALTYLHDIVESAKAKLPSAEKWYKATMDIQAARNRMNQEAERIVKMFTETGIRADKVNKMLFDATFEQKWPYDTQRLDRKTGQMVTIKADPELANRFDNELTAKERAIVKAVFAHGEKTLDHKYAVLKKLGLTGTFKAETGKLQGPYAPLKRFGNYISVLKSADLVAAEDAGDEKLTEKLKADPEHYEVRFHDTKGQASEYARANAKAGGQAYHFEKSERVGGALPMNSHVLSNIQAALKMDDKMPPQARAHFEQMLQELEFQALDEHHARTSGLTRKNRAGAEEDMMRSFLANARAQANFLAQLEYGKEANTQFYAMQREASKDGYAGQDEFNLLAKHYAASFDTQDTPIQNRITAMTTAFQLATSLGYHITNALQGVMVTVPKLAADFNDYTGAMDQLHNGYKTWLAAGGLKGKFDLDSVKDAGLRAALQHAADMGVLDVGMTEDLSQFEAFRTGYKGVDAASGKMSKLMHKLNQVSRYVETANRVSAATAAYNMAMAKHGDQAKAQEYAARILQTTQGDFSATGSPLIFKRLPKFVMQYKKYQFMMASLYANAFKAALHGATPEERAVGRRFLAYKLATTGVAAGFLGMPLMNVAALVFGMTGDDDEPRDLERSLRDWIGDDGMADVILRGPLNAIGLDMSAKLGDDKIFSIAPYTDIDFSSGASAAKTLVGIGGGPAASQLMRMATGVEYLSKGDMQKGFENLVPSGLANASKALRIANEGFTLKNGTVMYSPDEISGLTMMFDAIGLKSSQMKHMEWVRGQQYEIGQFVSDRTKELKADYVQAYRDGNTDELGKLSEHWLRLQEVKRDLRPMFNNSVDELKTQPLSDLLRSPANALKRDLKAQKASW